MDCDPAQVLRVVAGFVARTRGVQAHVIEPSTLLLQEGFLDSFSLVELTAELEAALGVSIPEGSLLPEDFASTQGLSGRLQQL